jgi:hypothetical protein
VSPFRLRLDERLDLEKVRQEIRHGRHDQSSHAGAYRPFSLRLRVLLCPRAVAHARPHLAPRLLACAAYSAVLIILAGIPHLPRLPSSITDVHAHAVAYGLHALVLYWTTAVLFSPLGSIGTAWLGASAFGGLTELYQLFRPPRTAELKDLVATPRTRGSS